ncbi:MAG: ABC transporter substrate-binding protein [Desulfobacteraceae bacterium]|jgi:phospholipid transport system substrate-binding protein|nr:ABC transporter substrate-binding protein [Desulfobacteraceae bacterium]
MKLTLTGILAVMVLAAVAGAQEVSAGPMEALKGPVNTVLQILQDPQYDPPEQRQLQRDRIWDVTRGIFDFTEMAKRSLALNWRAFTPRQRKEFTELFSELTAHSYLEQIKGTYTGLAVEFLGEEMLAGDKAMVKTKVRREEVETPVDYRMLQEGGRWLVYDVNIEGVSLVQNYRTQFREILAKETPEQLIQKLKDKLQEQKEELAEVAS